MIESMLYDPEQFPICYELSQHWHHFKDLYKVLDKTTVDLPRGWSHLDHFRAIKDNNGWTHSRKLDTGEEDPGWLTYILCCQDQFPVEAKSLYPDVVKLLSRYQGISVCGLSLLKPQSMILPHTHPELVGTDILSCQLGLIAEPQTCYLSVNGKFEEVVPGKTIVFDGTYQHFAVNVSNFDRVILYLEFSQTQSPFRESRHNDSLLPSLDIELAHQIVKRYGEILQDSFDGCVVDSSKLDHTKEQIKAALLKLLAVSSDPQQANILTVAFLKLSTFQSNIGDQPVSLSSLSPVGESWEQRVQQETLHLRHQLQQMTMSS